MHIVKIITLIAFFIVETVLIILCLLQSKQDTGASAAIMGGASDSFYEKNKGRTKDAKIDKTIVGLFILTVILIIALYLLP